MPQQYRSNYRNGKWPSHSQVFIENWHLLNIELYRVPAFYKYRRSIIIREMLCQRLKLGRSEIRNAIYVLLPEREFFPFSWCIHLASWWGIIMGCSICTLRKGVKEQMLATADLFFSLMNTTMFPLLLFWCLQSSSAIHLHGDMVRCEELLLGNTLTVTE